MSSKHIHYTNGQTAGGCRITSFHTFMTKIIIRINIKDRLTITATPLLGTDNDNNSESACYKNTGDNDPDEYILGDLWGIGCGWVDGKTFSLGAWITDFNRSQIAYTYV